MSPPLDSNEKTTDNKKETQTGETSDTIHNEAMDLFLNQVAEYNAQQLSFDHQSGILQNLDSLLSRHLG
jgi:hypothetical protein